MSPPDNAGPPAVALPEDDADDLDDEDAKVEAEAADANVEMWESALYASVDRSFNDLVSYAVSTENILAWTKPQYKGLTIYFSDHYKPSDPDAWTRLKDDLQASATREGFALVSKGSKGSSAADKARQVLICARGRVVPQSRRGGNVSHTRPLNAQDCCRFRLTIHQDKRADRYYIKGGQGNAFHRCHYKVEYKEGSTPKKKRARTSKAATSTAAAVGDNVVWHHTSLTRKDRWKEHKGAVLWFTGLSGSGKSSVANSVEMILHQRGVRTYLLDGDNLRHGLCQDLGFSAEDRMENLRRAAEVAKLMADAGMVVLAAFVSPYKAHRDLVKSIVFGNDIPFLEIYVKASLATCESRDPKGLYVKARAGELKNFTGISDPYEDPASPEVLLDSNDASIPVLADQVIHYLDFSGKIENE